ncbi:hypothetical protein ACLB1O_16955 [Escherichia coli]
MPRVELARCADGKILADKVKDKLELTATLTGLDYGRFTRSTPLSQGQFAAFLNAKPKERAELLEELTGTEIYGQISAMVFEQHKSARTELEKLQAQASGVALLTPEQVQSLTASLQVLTDEEKQLLTAQQQEQQSLNWLTRLDGIAARSQPPSAGLATGVSRRRKSATSTGSAQSGTTGTKRLRSALGTHRRTQRGAGAYSPAD